LGLLKKRILLFYNRKGSVFQKKIQVLPNGTLEMVRGFEILCPDGGPLMEQFQYLTRWLIGKIISLKIEKI